MERDVHHHRPCIQYVASLTKALQQSQEYADRPFPKVQANVQPLQPAEQCITRISCVCTRQCGPSKNSRPVGSLLSAFGICRAILMLPHGVYVWTLPTFVGDVCALKIAAPLGLSVNIYDHWCSVMLALAFM